MCVGVHVMRPSFLSDFNETWIFATDFRKKKSSSIKFHENPFSWNRVVPYGRTDMTKLLVTFRNFANAPKITAVYTWAAVPDVQ